MRKGHVMSKLAFIYPGQGAQKAGMGKDFYENSEAARSFFDQAQKILDFDLKEMCFGEHEELNLTEYTQPCMVSVCLAIVQELKKRGINPDITAGLSLGEYCALIASGAMTMADAFAVVRKRGIYMQEAVPTGGAMTAVLGLDPQVIEDICKKTADETNSVVSVANYNCPGQIVITGEKAAVDAAAAACSEAGAKRCVPLKVSGPFHSAMLKGAGEKLADALESVEIHDIKVPYITNVTADYVKSPADVKDYLTKQVSSSVRWQQTIERLIADGADEFVEIGPGRSLSGFMRKINRDVKVVNIDKLEDFEKYVNR